MAGFILGAFPFLPLDRGFFWRGLGSLTQRGPGAVLVTLRSFR